MNTTSLIMIIRIILVTVTLAVGAFLVSKYSNFEVAIGVFLFVFSHNLEKHWKE